MSEFDRLSTEDVAIIFGVGQNIVTRWRDAKLLRSDIRGGRGAKYTWGAVMRFACEQHLELLPPLMEEVDHSERKYRGVVKVISDYGQPSYRVEITHGQKKFHLGYFTDPALGAQAYDAKAKELKGDKARLNFPEAA